MDENCHVAPIQKTASDSQIRGADWVLLSIGGMGCPNCAARVRNGLLSLDGVYAADVYLNMAVAEVFYDGRKLSRDALKEAVQRAGNDGRHEYHAIVIATE